jgi:prepilin-type N-terminal cleavage/methylation domain-containing protein
MHFRRNGGAGTGCRGFTLIEALIGIVILSISFSGICGLIVQASKMTSMSHSQYAAVNIAKNRLERARTLDFNDLWSLAEDDVLVDVNGSPDPNGHFRRTTLVTSVETNLTELLITTETRNRVTLQFEQDVVTLSSLFARPEESG